MRPVEVTIAAFESGVIPLDQFNHRAHVTVAYLYLTTCGESEALDRMRAGIHGFNAAHKVPATPTSGYHETVTVAWMKLIGAAIRAYGPEAEAAAFLEQHPHLLCRTLLRAFYTRELIMSAEARQRFVEPDLAGLPA